MPEFYLQADALNATTCYESRGQRHTLCLCAFLRNRTTHASRTVRACTAQRVGAITLASPCLGKRESESVGPKTNETELALLFCKIRRTETQPKTPSSVCNALWESYVRRCAVASQKMCFAETVNAIQHFLVSIRFLCGTIPVCRFVFWLCVCAWLTPPPLNVRPALDISKRKLPFSIKASQHHAPEPQSNEKITSSTSQRFSLD